MAKRHGTETRQLDGGAVYVRLPPALAAAVRAEAGAVGLSSAAWLRHLAADAVGLPPEEAVPTPPVERRVVPPADLAEVSRLVGAVGMATGATVQLAKTFRETGHDHAHAEAEAVLVQMRGVARQLVDLVEVLR